MMTFFCIPKAFSGKTARLQRNALKSWLSLSADCEVLVFGDEAGIEKACAETGARHVPEISRNEYGTPLLDFAFREAASQARNDLLCYVNSDILFFEDFPLAAHHLTNGFTQFLGVGRRWNFDAPEDLVFQKNSVWRAKIATLIRAQGNLYDEFNLDYFLFPRPLFADIPAFSVGRPGWDNWMVYEARRLQIPVIDMTAMTTVGHQNHDYTHAAEGRRGGKEELWRGVEAERNRGLAGGHLFDIRDASHALDQNGTIHAKPNAWHFLKRLPEAYEIYPRWRKPLNLLHKLSILWMRGDRQGRLWLLRHGVDLFPHKEKRRANGSKNFPKADD